MKWLSEYWLLGFYAVLAICVAIYAIRDFMSFAPKKQEKKVKEWLLWACLQAEKELGSGTGAIKLRHVYDLFLIRFPFLVRVISFELFSKWVEETVVAMKKLLSGNKALQEVVNNDR